MSAYVGPIQEQVAYLLAQRDELAREAAHESQSMDRSDEIDTELSRVRMRLDDYQQRYEYDFNSARSAYASGRSEASAHARLVSVEVLHGEPARKTPRFDPLFPRGHFSQAREWMERANRSNVGLEDLYMSDVVRAVGGRVAQRFRVDLRAWSLNPPAVDMRRWELFLIQADGARYRYAWRGDAMDVPSEEERNAFRAATQMCLTPMRPDCASGARRFEAASSRSYPYEQRMAGSEDEDDAIDVDVTRIDSRTRAHTHAARAEPASIAARTQPKQSRTHHDMYDKSIHML